MVITDNVRELSKEIDGILSNLMSCLNTNELTNDPPRVCSRMSELALTLKNHLVAVDNDFYLALSRHPDEALVSRAKKCYESIGGTQEVFRNYNYRLQSADTVKEKTDAFTKESREVIEAAAGELIKRIMVSSFWLRKDNSV